jgi:50S ribosomal protein L16 3-hydroxylase
MTPSDMFRQWLAPLDLEAFRDQVLGERSLYREASAERLGPLLALGSWAPADLLAARRGDVVAWLQALGGELTTARVSPKAARELYASGTTLYLRDVESLRPLAEAVRLALRGPPKSVACAVFFNQPGATTRLHFDAVDTFTVQIAGRKRWRVAPNRHAPHPHAGWATLEREPSAELALYAHEPLPDRLPPDAEEFDLAPGAMLYVPRGHWHETDSDRESVSLHVHYLPTPWADVLLAALRARLLGDPAMRRGADHLWDPDRRAPTAERAATLLRSLAAAADALAVDDVLPTPAPRAARPEARYARRALAGLRVDRPADARGRVRVAFAAIEHGSERETTVEMSAAHFAACRAFAEAAPAAPLTAVAARARAPGLSEGEAGRLVGLLLEVGFLREVE